MHENDEASTCSFMIFYQVPSYLYLILVELFMHQLSTVSSHARQSDHPIPHPTHQTLIKHSSHGIQRRTHGQDMDTVRVPYYSYLTFEGTLTVIIIISIFFFRRYLDIMM